MVKPMALNSGIVISGGQVSVTQAVAGTGAQALYTASTTAASPELIELRQRLDELSAAMDRGQVNVQVQPLSALTEARAEAAKAQPDAHRLKDLMSVVAEGAKSVVSVTSAIQAITALVASF